MRFKFFYFLIKKCLLFSKQSHASASRKSARRATAPSRAVRLRADSCSSSQSRGAVVGGFLVGVFENLIGTYVPGVGSELKLTVALVLIVVVLLVRPAGLFGRVVIKRV